MKTGISPPLSTTHGGAQAAAQQDFPPTSPPPPPAAGVQHVSSSASPCSNDSSSGITNITYGKLCFKVEQDACDATRMDRDVIRIGDTSDEEELSLPPLPPRRIVGTTADGYAKRYLDMCTLYHCVEKNN